MATGIKYKNAVVKDGVSWQDLWNISATAAAKLDLVEVVSGNGVMIPRVTTTQSITITDYNNFPTGTIVFDAYAKKIHQKYAATTWVAEDLT